MPVLELAEDTYLKAFGYAALVVGLTTAVTLEYRAIDPFGTFRRQFQEDQRLSGWNMAQSVLVSTLSTFLILWLFYFIFGFGRSFVAETAKKAS